MIKLWGRTISTFTFISVILGILLSFSGTVVAYVSATNGDHDAEIASVVFVGVGVMQLVIGNLIHAFTTATGPGVLTIVNCVVGALQMSTGAILTYATTLGAQQWVTLVLGIIGGVQLLATAVEQYVLRISTPMTSTVAVDSLRDRVAMLESHVHAT